MRAGQCPVIGWSGRAPAPPAGVHCTSAIPPGADACPDL